jgi:O-antigen/teichoic acid export membrane protein
MLSRLLSAMLRSQRQFLLGQVVEVLLIPVIVILALLAGLAHTVHEILWWTAGAGLATATLALVATLARTRTGADTINPTLRETWRIAIPLWGVAIMLNLSDWYSLTTAATMLGVYDAGLYRVAIQIGSVFGIIAMGLFSVYSVRIGAAHAQGDRHEIGRITRAATLLSSALVLPAIVLLLLFAEPLLALIGPEFEAAASLVRIVAIGQALYAITGPAGLALAMTGHERVNLLITVVSTALLLLLAPLSAHFFGLMGIAISVSLLLIGRNLASLWAVRRLVGVNVMSGSVRDHAAAAAPG